MLPFLNHTIQIYVNEIRVKWNQFYTKGVTLSTNITKINILLFADEKCIITDSEDELQWDEFSVNAWEKKKFWMELSQEKSETMAFSGQEPARSKTTVGNKHLQ